jgi:very-short-patch-repair endonuclease
LRRSLTPAESRLWAKLRNRQLGGFKFIRQEPLGPYYADFVCWDRRLIVEVD